MNLSENHISQRKQGIIFIATLCIVFLINLDATIVNVGLPAIADTFSMDLRETNWVITSFLMLTTTFFIVGGKLARTYGEKKLFLTGTFFFFLGSLLAGCASSFLILLSGRIFQGLGFAIVYPATVLLMLSVFPEHKKGVVLGYMTGVSGFAQAIGPFLGGILVGFWGWHSIFLINIPVVLFAGWGVLQCVPKDKNASKGSIPFPSMAFLVIFLMILLTWVNTDLNWIWSGVFLCGALFFLFLLMISEKKLIAAKEKAPLIGLELMKNSLFKNICFMRALHMVGFVNTLFLLPLFLENIMGYSTEVTGLILLMMTASYGALAIFMGRWVDLHGTEKITGHALILGLIAQGALGVVGGFFFSWIPFVLALILFGISTAMITPSSLRGMLVTVLPSFQAVGTGVFYTFMFMGGIFGMSLTTGIMNGWTRFEFFHHAVKEQIFFTDKTWIQPFLTGTQPLHALYSPLTKVSKETLEIWAQHSFRHGYFLVTMMNVLALGFAFFLMKWKKK